MQSDSAVVVMLVNDGVWMVVFVVKDVVAVVVLVSVVISGIDVVISGILPVCV